MTFNDICYILFKFLFSDSYQIQTKYYDLTDLSADLSAINENYNIFKWKINIKKLILHFVM